MKEKRNENKWVDKEYTLLDLVQMHPYWIEYLSKKIMSNESSPLCGLPKRKITEVRSKPGGGYLVRYKLASLSK